MSAATEYRTFQTYSAERRHLALAKFARGAVFALMLGGLFTCTFVVTFGLLCSAMEAQTFSVDDQ